MIKGNNYDNINDNNLNDFNDTTIIIITWYIANNNINNDTDDSDNYYYYNENIPNNSNTRLLDLFAQVGMNPRMEDKERKMRIWFVKNIFI